MRITITTAMLVAMFSTVLRVEAAATPAQKCEAGKNGAAGKYAACLHKAQQKFVGGGAVDEVKRNAAVIDCGSKYSNKWQSLEEKAGSLVCPSENDESSLRSFLDACIFSVEDALGGGTLPTDVVTCASDLAACEAQPLGRIGKTGQTSCYDVAGSVIACAGTGQDGEALTGIAKSFTDNGDGTVTDDATGLMWEKQSDDGSIHDMDNQYSWTNAVITKVATLNSTSFAGFDDWRLPNIRELESLKNFGAVMPAVFGVFNTDCAPGCTVLTCSCTRSFGHWSSSTYQNDPVHAWGVQFLDGHTYIYSKAVNPGVRAVRGGL